MQGSNKRKTRHGAVRLLRKRKTDQGGFERRSFAPFTDAGVYSLEKENRAGGIPCQEWKDQVVFSPSLPSLSKTLFSRGVLSEQTSALRRVVYYYWEIEPLLALSFGVECAAVTNDS